MRPVFIRKRSHRVSSGEKVPMHPAQPGTRPGRVQRTGSAHAHLDLARPQLGALGYVYAEHTVFETGLDLLFSFLFKFEYQHMSPKRSEISN